MVRLVRPSDGPDSLIPRSLRRPPSNRRLGSLERPTPVRSIEQLIQHPERITHSRASSAYPHDDAACKSPRAAALQATKLNDLLMKNLEIYQGHLYWGSYSDELVDLDPALVPRPLFHNPHDRRLFGPRLPPVRQSSSGLIRNTGMVRLPVFSQHDSLASGADDYGGDSTSSAFL